MFKEKQKVVVGQSEITAGQMKDFWRMVDDGTLDGKVLAYILANIATIRQDALGANFVTEARARTIMGRNFFGREKAKEYLGFKLTEEYLRVLNVIPFTEETLRQCKDTHILVAVLPCSILDIRAKVDPDLFYKQTWYDNEQFAKEKGTTGWHLVRKTLVENSTNKTWDEQQTLIVKEDETPSARVMTYTIIGHYLATGERLFENIYVRTSSLDSGGNRVYVGYFDQDGLHLDYDWGDYRSDSLGVASARKVQLS